MDIRPFSITEWRTFLRDYSSKFLDNSSSLRVIEKNGAGTFVRSHVQREGWIGYEPASADAIVAAEERLGTRLPPTYRNFLMASDGFGYVDHVDLLNVDEIGWLPERDPDLVEAWSFGIDDVNREMFERSLLIARDDGGPGVCWLLLYPEAAAEDGEWAAYEWFTGDGSSPDDDRYDNFGALLLDAARRLDAD
ncbi:SMI1/KNR4 family protein [Saccharopolyspora sp. ASAGF58]|uniref:SMI1/KNR4 family protein n=1 Tax=Saccharopolyspora sp. ASAGF58 TaxID=2719023 RepID=UPI0014400AC9|nr:SMI1/KNR4 family protein [Saccharopolyspora sp. ASAGF58]QIZ38203.1 SMI1/KNR4 family protein [Saccharopolyspora sp. ASAGF58]